MRTTKASSHLTLTKIGLRYVHRAPSKDPSPPRIASPLHITTHQLRPLNKTRKEGLDFSSGPN